MTRNSEDVRADEVRRRIKDLLAGAGVDQGRIAVEILFMLPSEFVRTYSELYDMALSDGISGSGGGSGGGGGGKDEGRVKASGSNAGGRGGGDPLNARTPRAASGSGKRYRKALSPLRSELALDEKRKLDRRLVKAASDAMRAARSRNVEDGKGKSVEKVKREKPRCSACGRGMATGWERCPYHG